ncbi:hypothetical protein LguiA_004728 [Lonicera macranthoides]
MAGILPGEIAKLNLESLVLTRNNLQGLIPFKIFNISTIIDISLSWNHFSGHLPLSMGLWIPNLESLYLGNNRWLNGSIPSSISNASKLTIIDMASNSFIGFIPNTLGNLSSLTSLVLDSNELVGFIPATLGTLENLEQLYLEHNVRIRKCDPRVSSPFVLGV